MYAWLNIGHVDQNISVTIPDGKKVLTDNLEETTLLITLTSKQETRTILRDHFYTLTSSNARECFNLTLITISPLAW